MPIRQYIVGTPFGALGVDETEEREWIAIGIGVDESPAVTGLAVTLADATLVATGEVTGVGFNTGTLSVTLAAATLVATGTAPASFGTLTTTLGDATAVGHGMGYGLILVGLGTNVEVSATTHTLIEPSGVQQGDLLVSCISSRIASTTAVTLPATWTLVGQRLNNNTATNNTALSSCNMAYVVRGASPPSFTFTHPTAPSVAIGRVVAYRKLKGSFAGAALDVAGSFTTGTAITAVSGAGITTTTANDLLVALASGGQEAVFTVFDAATDPSTDSGSGADSTTNMPVAGTWLRRSGIQTTTGVDTSYSIFDAVKATAGATGNLTTTASIAAGHSVVIGSFKVPVVSVGTVFATLGAATLAATGTVSGGLPAIEGSLNVTLGAATAAATGTVLVQGRLGAAATAPTTSFLTSYTPPSIRNDFDGDVGFKFTVSTGQDINWLGCRVVTGNTGSHTVKLYNHDTQALLATATIDMTGKTVGTTAWAAITPVTLATSTTYALVKQVAIAAGQSWGEVANTTLASPVTSVSSVYRSNSTGTFSTYTAGQQYVGLDLGSGDVTAGYPLDAATLSATGTVEDADVTSLGALDVTLGAATLSATGTVANQIFSGALAATLAPATLAATGTVLVQGTLGTTLGAATLAATGKVTVGGTLGVTLGDATLVGTGIVANQIFSGALTTTLGAATLAGTGTVANQIFSGTLSATLADATLVAEGTGLTVSLGALTVTLGPATLVSTGTVANQVFSGTLSTTLAPATLVGTGKVTVAGTAAITLAPATLVSTGTVVNQIFSGTLTATLAPATLAGTGKVIVSGTLGTTLAAATALGTGKVLVAGALTSTLAPATLVASGSVASVISIGTLATTLDAATLVATGTVAPGPATGYAKVWTGSAWMEKPVKVWSGSAWVTKPVKHWNGSTWTNA